MTAFVEDLMAHLSLHHPGEDEFHQAVERIAASVELVVERNPQYRAAKIMERMVEPQRAVIFRVPWVDDAGEIQVNRGYRVEMNNAIGPFKGGLRFHPTVNLGEVKFLAFEQTLKNALTTLSMGGAKGGSDFDPKGKSDNEVMRFCQSFMMELSRHIGPNVDVPAGDIGVGHRELGYMFGQYKRLTNEFTGAITGKGLSWGGSRLRPEATGYGLVYFVQEMLAVTGDTLEGKRALVSGSGNVAQFAALKLLELGALPITLSDSGGFIHDPDGITAEKLDFVFELKNERRGRISEYVDAFPGATFTPLDPAVGHNPLWNIPADLALPCATQNEIHAADAEHLVANGVTLVAEGANMPTDARAIDILIAGGVRFAPGKAANAGGVAVSGLEMAQNAQHTSWTRSEVDVKLHQIMKNIHRQCAERAAEYGVPGNYVHGANIAGFIKVADAMLDQGVV